MLKNFLVESRNSQLTRNDSFSTVSSSVAAAEIKQQIANLSIKSSPNGPHLTASSPSNINFENSDNIQITYNNFYNHLADESMKSSQLLRLG